MLVERIMQSTLVTVTPETTLAEAFGLTRQRGIRHLLVVEDDRLVGIVSDRDLKGATGTPTMGEIMTRAVMTLPPSAPVEDAARLMVREKISAVPVTLGDRLLGMVTETDVLRLFVRALGAAEPSSRLEVTLGPERTALTDIVRTVEAAGIPISSLMTLSGPDGSREVVIRVPTINPLPAVRALAASGYPVKTPWRDSPIGEPRG
jgi:acetoin utilization protein AcuB